MNTKCEHRNIEFVTEIPTNGKSFQQEKKYVRCEDCKELLPIDRIIFTEIKVPLYPKFD